MCPALRSLPSPACRYQREPSRGHGSRQRSGLQPCPPALAPPLCLDSQLCFSPSPSFPFSVPPHLRSEALPITLPGPALARPQHPCPLTLVGSHSEHNPASSFILHQEEEQLIVQGPLFAPVVIQGRGQSQSHVGMDTSHTAVGGQGTSPKGSALCTVPVQWTPVSD